jgi:hypothetical protein
MINSNSKSHIPWSVKGVSKEARAAAKKAAANQGITMGEWLTQAIRSGGDDVQNSGVAVTQDELTSGSVSWNNERNGNGDGAGLLRQGLFERIGQSEKRIVRVVESLQEIIQQMALRIEALEGQQVAAPLRSPAPAEPKPTAFHKAGWDD